MAATVGCRTPINSISDEAGAETGVHLLFFRQRSDSNSLRAMDDISPTFPTIRRWRRMSETDQDALLDTIESRRRWRAVRARALIAAAGLGAIAAGIAVYLAMQN